MSHPSGPAPRIPGSVIALVGLLLLIPIVFPLLVGTYAKRDPELWGFPFFYWYQFMWIVISAVLTSIAYLIISAYQRRNRDRTGRGDNRL